MKPSKEEDHPSNEFVKLDDVVQWEEKVEPCGSHPGENMTEHQNENKSGVEVQTGTTTSCY